MRWQEVVDGEKTGSESSVKRNQESKHWRMTKYIHLSADR